MRLQRPLSVECASLIVDSILLAGPTSAMGNETLEPLPDAPPNLAGESEDRGSRYHITVSNASGYLCNIHMQVRGFVIASCMAAALLHDGSPRSSLSVLALQSTFSCHPETIFRIFTNPGAASPCWMSTS